MNMNIMIKAPLLVLCALGGQAAQADNLPVTGRLIQSACTVQPLPSVDLGILRDVDMLAIGSVSTPKAFQLNVTNCPSSATQVTATFSGTASTDPGLFMATGSATGMGMKLMDVDHSGTQIRPNGTSTVTADGSRNATFNLKAQVVTDQATQTTGNLTSSITVGFTYQ